jgi:Zn-dependent peptidase ImmA (M78 family)
MVLPNCWRAEARAAEVIKQHEVSNLPVNPFRIAKHEGIVCYKFEAIAPGISGCLMKVGDEFGIFYSDRFASLGFRNFTVAHELGHYFLPGHIEYVFAQGEGQQHQSESGFVSDNRYEREADAFAAALLMPGGLVGDIFVRIAPGLKSIEAISNQCGTSLTAAAIRYASLTDSAVTVICSEGNRVKFAFMSEAVKARRDLTWIKKNSGIPVGTGTFKFNKDLENVYQGRRRAERAKMDIWFDCGGTGEVVEEMVGLGVYGKTLTVLSGDSLSDLEEEDQSDENDLENMLPSDRWRRHRSD